VAFAIIGDELAGRTRRPFTHLLTPAHERPALRIELWDEGETGVPGEGCEVDEAIDEGKGDIVTVSADKRYVILRRARSHAIYDRQEKLIRGWSKCAGRPSLTELGRPLQYLICYWLCDSGDQLLHSGMIARGDVGLLIAGRSGSGKSTTSLLCLEAGLEYVGDDLLAMAQGPDGDFVASGVYGTNHLSPGDLRRWPGLAPHALVEGRVRGEKSVLMLDDAFPGLLRATCPIRGILLPRITAAPATALRPATGGEALRAIAPSSIALIEGLIPQGLERIAALVGAVPAYWLELGRDFHSTPGEVCRLMESLHADA